MGDRVRGKVALVTGAAEGIGEACSRLLAQEGASVILADIQTDKAEAAAAALGDPAFAVTLDVTSEADWAAAIDTVRARFGRLDVLVHNAGINPGAKSVEDLSLEEWRRILSVNLDSAYLAAHACLPLMRETPGGSIINIASAAGLRAHHMLPAYSASKGGMRLLTKSLAGYCGRLGTRIRVNAILPGSVETPMVDRLRSATGDADKARAATAALHPIGHVGAPEDIGWAVVWLASDEARFVTGADIPVDGGLTM